MSASETSSTAARRRAAADGPLHLVGRRDHVRRVLGDRQLPPLAVEDPAALARDVTVWVCWPWASALSSPPWTPCTQAARPIARQNSSRKQANSRPIRRSITATGDAAGELPRGQPLGRGLARHPACGLR